MIPVEQGKRCCEVGSILHNKPTVETLSNAQDKELTSVRFKQVYLVVCK
jgi:hypothetical protein